MSFGRRLRLFIFGILLGSLVVWGFLFRGRTFPAWTPEGRVLESLQEHPVKISNEARCLLDCNKISDQDILQLIADGDVLFSQSDIRGKEVPEYVVEGKGTSGKTYKMKFRSEYLSTLLITIIPTPDASSTCDCSVK
jgi:hypothetical protein